MYLYEETPWLIVSVVLRSCEGLRLGESNQVSLRYSIQNDGLDSDLSLLLRILKCLDVREMGWFRLIVLHESRIVSCL